MKLSDFDKMTFINKTKTDLFTYESYLADDEKHFDLDRVGNSYREIYKDPHSKLAIPGPWWRVRNEDDASR